MHLDENHRTGRGSLSLRPLITRALIEKTPREDYVSTVERTKNQGFNRKRRELSNDSFEDDIIQSLPRCRTSSRMMKFNASNKE